MLSEKLQNFSDKEFADVIDADFSNAKKEEKEPINLKQEAKKLIEAEVEMSPENFGDSRLRQPQSSWLERASESITGMMVENFKYNSKESQVKQHEFDQSYFKAVEAYNEVETQIKNIKDLLRKLAGNKNIGENKKE